MRLICTIKSPTKQHNPHAFSYYLSTQGIQNECEHFLAESGSVFRIWVYEEDQVERAQHYYQHYQENPDDKRYQVHAHPSLIAASEREETPPETREEDEEELDEPASPSKKRRFLSPAPYGPLSTTLLFLSILFFIWSQFGRTTLTPPTIPGIISAPLLSPLERQLLYDYPTYFELRDQLLQIYPKEESDKHLPPSEEAREWIQHIQKTPVWMGIYEHLVSKESTQLDYTSMYEKMRQGQLWRLVTPALLHFDLLHIFFNLLWFIMLGNQIEFRLGWWRYLIFVVALAIFSNTLQYLMSGPFFMGLSGVVVGMAAFIWARQQRAPWEGYLLQRFTVIFLAIFVIGMFLLQIIFFFLQLSGTLNMTMSIANTAHLAGALMGYLLGRSRFFAISTLR